MTQLLQVTGIRKGFPGVQALDGVDFELDRGELLALVGENGAGKSTLMKILSGIYHMDAGSILIDDRPVVINTPLAAQHLGISIIHQEMNLMPHLTVAQNIYIGREPRTAGIFTDEVRLNRQARELLNRTQIDLDPRALVDHLTVAKQQMVEIAKALSFESTKILIMDEPTSALTGAETDILFTLIRGLKSQGVGIIYISHRMEELKQIADRVTVLRDGRYIGTRSIAEVDEREIISMMVGREISGTPRTVSNPPATDDVVLQVQGLSTRRLLRDVSFDLRRGEVLGFAGLMGAGRTEVARAIIGADRIDHGQIFVNQRPVHIRHPAEAVAHGIGYLSEDRKRYGLLLERDVNTNILLASLKSYANGMGFMKSARGRRTSRQYVDALKIKTPSIDAVTKNLSGGNQQKVVIAKWLARDCDILIFDEPTRGIDVGAKEEIYALLAELAAAGKSIIVISSELPEVLRVSDRIVVMSQGKITGTLTRDQLTGGEADSEMIMSLATRYGVELVDSPAPQNAAPQSTENTERTLR